MAMTRDGFLEKLLQAYHRYYDVITDPNSVTSPFVAEAVFHSHSSQYFLVKSAAISESDSHEYIFVASVDTLDEKTMLELDETAWSAGMSRVKPHADHQSSDVIVVVLADTITPEASALVKKLKHFKSYHHMLQGWSCYKLVAVEISSGRVFYNRRGTDQKKLFNNILKSFE